MEPWISFVAEKISLASFLIREKIKEVHSKKMEERNAPSFGRVKTMNQLSMGKPKPFKEVNTYGKAICKHHHFRGNVGRFVYAWHWTR
jgi:hypothetical protein